jgi:RNA polymerase sigma factor (sigma-70 family)
MADRKDMAMKRDVLANHYDGVVESWKAALVQSRAKRFGIPRHEWPDLEQEIVLELMEFRFDATKANGASEATAVTSVIDNRLLMFLRRTKTRCRRAEDLRADETESVRESEGESACAVMDVQRALATLPATEQVVCAALSRGNSMRKIAAALGCSRASVERMVQAIRYQFERMGLSDRIGH